MRIYLSILLLFLSFQLEAQLLDGAKQKFSKADTLRGALRPERTCFDVTYYELNIDLAIETRAISGSNKMFFTTIENFHTLQIDLFENMQIDRIIFKGTELNFHREFNAVFVDFPEELLVG